MASDKVLLDTSGNRQLFGGTNDGKIHLGDTGDGCNCTPPCPDASLCCTPVIATIGTNTVSMGYGSSFAPRNGFGGSNPDPPVSFQYDCIMTVSNPCLDDPTKNYWVLTMATTPLYGFTSATNYSWQAPYSPCPPTNTASYVYQGSTNPTGLGDPGISSIGC